MFWPLPTASEDKDLRFRTSKYKSLFQEILTGGFGGGCLARILAMTVGVFGLLSEIGITGWSNTSKLFAEDSAPPILSVAGLKDNLPVVEPPRIRQALDIGTDKQLFLDDYVIAHMDNVAARLNQPTKYQGNPLIAPPFDRPGAEELVVMGGSVIYDQEERLFKMWYEATDYWRSHSAVAYATSVDGVRWNLPNLGLVDFPEWSPKGRPKENNFVVDFRRTEQCPCVFKDPAARDGERKYKMVYTDKLTAEEYYALWPQSGAFVEAIGGSSAVGPPMVVFAAFSPDGIHWSTKNTPVFPISDSFHSLLWDPVLGRYVAHIRSARRHLTPSYERVVLQCESEDFLNWEPYGIIMKPDENDTLGHRQFYNMEWMPYENVFIGFLSVYHTDNLNRPPEQKGDDTVDVQLTFSRDNRHWERVGNRETFLATGATPGSYDHGMVWNILQHPIVVGDEIWIYYNGTCGKHGALVRGEKWGGVIALAKLRRDGFVSIDATQTGVLTTKRLRMAGEKLVVNADARGGSIQVELLDATGSPIPGFTKDEADPINMDDVQHMATWKGSGDVRSLQGQPIVLKFYLTHSRLFSFAFQK